MAPTPALTVLELKGRCRELGIPVGGKKADLIARIKYKLSTADKATPTTSSASTPQSGGAHVSITSGTAIRTSKATTKRKASAKNPSYAPNGKTPGNRRAKRPKNTKASLSIPGSAPSGTAACNPPSDLHNTTTPSADNTITSEGSISIEFLGPASLSVFTINPHQQATRALNPTASFSVGPIITPQNLTLRRTPSRVTEQLRVIAQSKNPGCEQRQGDLNIAPLGTKTATKGSSNSEKVCAAKKNRLVPANQQKQAAASVPSNINERRELAEGPKLAKAHKPNFGGLVVSSPLVQVKNSRMSNTDKGMVASNVIQTHHGGTEQSLVGGAIRSTTETNSDLSIGLLMTPCPRSARTAKTKVRLFKRLEPNSKVNLNTDTAINYSPEVTTALPSLKQDHEISASIIRNPPRYSLRQQVEKVAHILALVGFHEFSTHTNTSVPGDFLRLFAGLSRNYRYASTLAFTYLIRLEFPGRRTENWLRNRRIDEKVSDVRSWYWHRVSERTKVIEWFRMSWMERVWRFLVVASKLAGKSAVGSGVVAYIKPGGFGLWFNGIGKHLLADPDIDGQFETAIRFWVRRFYIWVTRNGGGYPLLLQDLRDEMVQNIQPLDETENRDIWRVETKCGSVHFIVGMTGEVVGLVGVDGMVGNGLESVRQRRVKARVGTMIRAKAGARTLGRAFTTITSQENDRNRVNIDGITWQDLREDWREYASALVSSPSPLPDSTNTPPQRLIESVYRPDPKSVSHGIHKSVKLPHHRALAERWVLAQVEPGGISGKPVLEAVGQARKKEKLVLDLQAKLTVESIRCAGEKWISSMKGVLAQGVGFVQTPEMGWFVLEETGQNIAQEEYGIQGLWATVLGVDENGAALSADDLEGLADMFVWKDILD